uniref:Uncharacterized protein n=1 Tax=Aegilops tauschii subsp. strangulata TaxID=200361 RepID=A0A453RHX7_AEGTS|nr:uncharacterized protein LOC109781274 isoform X1 [Aegilops tauschii subsp. strangulata]
MGLHCILMGIQPEVKDGIMNLRVRENDSRRRKGPVLIEKSEALPWRGNYKSADLCIFGYHGLIPAFKEMHAFVQTGKCKSKEKLEMAGQTFIWHLPEASRSDNLFQDIDDNFFIGGKFGMERLKAARCWSDESEEARSGMHFAEKSETYTACPAKKQDTTPEMKRTVDIIENIRLLYRPDHVHARLQLTDMPIHLGKEGPIGDLWANQHLIDVHMSSFSFLGQRISISGSYSIGSLVEENTWSATDNHPVKRATKKLDSIEENAAINGHGVGLYNLAKHVI